MVNIDWPIPLIRTMCKIWSLRSNHFFFSLQRSFRTPTHKSNKGSGGSFFHRRLSSKSPHRNTSTNLTQEIHVDKSSTSSIPESTVVPAMDSRSLGSIGADNLSLDSGLEDISSSNGHKVEYFFNQSPLFLT